MNSIESLLEFLDTGIGLSLKFDDLLIFRAIINILFYLCKAFFKTANFTTEVWDGFLKQIDLCFMDLSFWGTFVNST